MNAAIVPVLIHEAVHNFTRLARAPLPEARIEFEPKKLEDQAESGLVVPLGRLACTEDNEAPDG